MTETRVSSETIAAIIALGLAVDADKPKAIQFAAAVDGTRFRQFAQLYPEAAAFVTRLDPSTVLSAFTELRDLREAVAWIRKIADMNLEDGKLRAQGARTLKRIADKCDAVLPLISETPNA